MKQVEGDLSSYEELARKSNEKIVDFLLAYVGSVVGQEIGESFWVPMLLLSKVLRCHEAIQTLVKIGLSSEAASVAITQFEIRLDLLYIFSGEKMNLNRAKIWVEHAIPTRQPWPVKNKLNEIYGENPGTRKVQGEMYERLSEIKHANPLSEQFGLPISKKGKKWQMTSGSFEDPHEEFYGRIMLTLSSLSILESAEVAAKLFSRLKTVPREFFDDIAPLMKAAAIAWHQAFEQFRPGASNATRKNSN